MIRMVVSAVIVSPFRVRPLNCCRESVEPMSPGVPVTKMRFDGHTNCLLVTELAARSLRGEAQDTSPPQSLLPDQWPSLDRSQVE